MEMALRDLKKISQIQNQQHLQKRSADACTAVRADTLQRMERSTALHLQSWLKVHSGHGGYIMWTNESFPLWVVTLNGLNINSTDNCGFCTLNVQSYYTSPSLF